MKNSIWDVHSHGWMESPAQGFSGGILTTWDLQHYTHVSHTVNKNWILFKGATTTTNIQFIVINVYAPQSTGDKYVLWEQLSSIISNNTDIPICLMRDFNSVMDIEDRTNCIHSNLDTSMLMIS